MRTVAVAIVVLGLLGSFPTAVSIDECAYPGALSFCREIDASRPNSPPGVPTLPSTPYWGTYYLWLGVGHCVGTNLNDCRSYPPEGPTGVPMPTCNQQIPCYVSGPAAFGLLFQESNGMGGLQRFPTNVRPDRMVLV